MTPTITVAPRLTATVISDPAELERLRTEWLELMARSSSNDAMLTPTWLLNWWHVYGSQDGRRLMVTLFREGERLVGLAPLLKRRHWYRPGIPFRRIEPLGSGERENEGIYSDYLNVIAEKGSEEQVAAALVASLTSGSLGPWDEFAFPMMNGESPMPALLASAFNRAGVPAQTLKLTAASYIPLPATWDEYLQTLTKKHRYNVNRCLREFEAWAGGAAKVERATSSGDLEKGKRILVELHHERWEGEGGVFRSPNYVRFHDVVMPQLLDEGALELLWLSVRGEPVAAMYNLVWDNKVYFYQCGRKTDVPRQVRPGSVLLYHAIRSAIEAGRREFDFLGGPAAYKLDLALANRPLVQLRAARPSLVERTRCLAKWGRDALRRALGQKGQKK
jgi:CelD/BcsL family acetyltransferase involved in cellulose biosynthesis